MNDRWWGSLHSNNVALFHLPFYSFIVFYGLIHSPVDQDLGYFCVYAVTSGIKNNLLHMSFHPFASVSLIKLLDVKLPLENKCICCFARSSQILLH